MSWIEINKFPYLVSLFVDIIHFPCSRVLVSLGNSIASAPLLYNKTVSYIFAPIDSTHIQSTSATLPVRRNSSENTTKNCNNPEHGQFNSMDRLSDLPDFILHLIISYLDTKEAYKTTVLSKRWNQTFATNPILNLYLYKFSEEYIDTRMQKFSKENLRITRFRLDVPATDLLSACKLDDWLEIAVRNHVAEIALEGRLANYKLPRTLFSANSLTHLDFANVEIPYYEALDLVSLELLNLRDVVVDERMLFHIVSSCPSLKDLRLSFCPGVKNVLIPRHSKLGFLYIDGDVPEDGRVILENSSLTTFKYNANGVHPWPIISNRGLLRNLKNLSITSLSITGEDLGKVLLELASLEKLVFIGCQYLTNVKISHTRLKRICFLDCDCLLDVVIDAPSLNKFKFDAELDPSLSITIHSRADCNIHLLTMACSFDTDGFFKLKKLLKGLNSCSALKISLIGASDESSDDDDDVEFDEEESVNNGELGPPCDIGKLKLNPSYCELSSASLSAFLNGLFWTCHPPLISLPFKYGHHKLKVEPLLNNLVDMVKCLRHPLKRFEVEETNNGSDFLDIQLRLCW